MVKLFAKPLPIDPQTNKAEALNMLSVARPYMRGLTFSWLSFMTAFTGWFAFAPIMPTVKGDLKLTDSQVADSNIASVSSTIIFRLLVGPLCDFFGPRRTMAILLFVGAIPVGLSGFVNSYHGLIIARFFIGILGASFVPCQFWTTQMFHRNTVGTANAIAGGWGNMGAGVTYVMMSLIVDGLQQNNGLSAHDSWRVGMVIPALLLVVVGIAGLLLSDDCPEGKWRNRRGYDQQTDGVEIHEAKDEKKESTTGNDKERAIIRPPPPRKLKTKDFLYALQDFNVVLMMFQYACCFGVELAVDNVIATFFHEQFSLSKKKAGLVASLFGLMNLFSRASGGFLSDGMNRRFGIRGRLFSQFAIMFLEGAFLVAFRFSLGTLGSAIVVMIIFSFFVQAACGTTFGIVPFVNPPIMGAVSGLVGAGGNVGGLVFAAVFKKFVGHDTPIGFMVIGLTVLAIATTTFLLRVEGRHLIEFGKRSKS